MRASHLRLWAAMALTVATGLGLMAIAYGQKPDQRKSDEPAKAGVPAAVLTSTPLQPGQAVAHRPSPSVGPCFIPQEIHDPPFDRHVDLLLLGQAWDYHDAAFLADIGLQLAEGERILMRPHRALDFRRILEIAAHIAGDDRDSETLARLAKAAESIKDSGLTDAVAEARKVSEASHDGDHLKGHAIEDLSPRAIAMHQGAIRKIRALRLAGDTKGLEEFDKHLDTIAEFHVDQQRHLDEVIRHARSRRSKNGSLKATIQLLDRLAAQTPCFKID